jgi:hypothetical protein
MRIGFGEVAHALLFNAVAGAYDNSEDALDDATPASAVSKSSVEHSLNTRGNKENFLCFQ